VGRGDGGAKTACAAKRELPKRNAAVIAVAVDGSRKAVMRKPLSLDLI